MIPTPRSFGTASSLLAILAAFAAPANAAPASQAAAPAGTRAVEQAGDAFGVRIGVEQIGLYSESQVRGLSLQDAGNYRLGGAYFVRAGSLVDPILSGVVTRVGFNALEADFPSPSGIVEYRLRSPLDYRGSSAELSLREYGGAFGEAITSIGLGSSAGLLVGAAANLANSSAGFDNNSYRFGAVGEWRPGPARLLVFGSLNVFDLQGFYGVSVTGDRLPPRQRHPNPRLLPDWGDHDGQDKNAGAIVSVAPTSEVELRGSLIYSRLDLDRSDFANLAIGPDGTGRATLISNRPRDVDAVAGAVAASWSHAPGRRLFGEVRLRASRNAFAPAVALAVPAFDQAVGLPDTEEPDLSEVAQTLDKARQLTVGLGYEARFKRLRLKAGLQRAHYRRSFAAPDAERTATTETPLLYDASAVLALGERSTAFATLTRGLEDTGVAPSNAVNRNEVLPAVVAEQREIGLRHRLTDELTLIASAFSIEKPTAVFDGNGLFSLSGDVRHQGLELSLAGRPVPALRVVTGAALLDAERSGERVRLGLTSKEVPGVSRYQLLGGVTWSVPGAQGLSLDAQVNHAGSRLVRSDRDLRTPAYTTVDVGGLYAFRLGAANAALRLRVNNLFDTDAWIAGRSELIDRVSRRGVRLSLTLRDQR